MNRSDLIGVLSEETGLSINRAKEVVNLVFNSMANALTDGDRVEIRGFCSIYVKQYKGYTGHNPKTGVPIKVKPKRLPFFKCGKELKERMNLNNKNQRRK